MADSIGCRDRRGRFRKQNTQIDVSSAFRFVENIEIEHNYECGNHVYDCGANGCEMCCPGIGKLVESRKVNTSRTWSSGRRLVIWAVLLDNLKFCKQCNMGPLPLTNDFVKGEMKCGLSKYLYVQCSSCMELNRVPYGSHHRDPSKPKAKGMPAMLDSIGGPQRVYNVLTTLNLPSISHKNLKVMERRAGDMIEDFANISMERRGREAFAGEMMFISINT
ncbi:Hypothetical predicted protein [Mytilus galloprovincialis]|uniref:Mutator-like transposase domain-containing protein n=1 Tax=Mytilus galloprovincialis TaxID=29158 RepID=A0A8B6GER9_MYTGA|nr:Hypothetical predicted protein [Mytilus galloprovincialis]